MSRSYKKTYCVKDKNPGVKQIFNRKFRRTMKSVDFDDVPKQPGYYRRCNERWDLCEYKSMYFGFQDFLDGVKKVNASLSNLYSNDIKAARVDWKKWYRCK